MPDNVIDGVVKITEEELSKINKDGVGAVDDATLQALADKSGDTVEHIKEMLKLADGETDIKDVKIDDEKLLAGKYKSEEDLDKGIQSLIDKYGKETAYKMLEANVGKSDLTDAEKAAVDKAAADALSGDDAAARAAADKVAADKVAADAAAKAGDDDALDFEQFTKEYAENSALTDESYEKLAKAGLDKGLVDSYIAGLDAQSTLYSNEIMKLAGGEDQFNAIVKWGSANLSNEERVRFNDAMDSFDTPRAATMITALKARYEATEGSFSRESVQAGDNIKGNSGYGYLSTQEMQRDMVDPRYKAGDKAFHDQVKMKIKNSKIM